MRGTGGAMDSHLSPFDLGYTLYSQLNITTTSPWSTSFLPESSLILPYSALSPKAG